MRSAWQQTRVARLNLLRGLLREFRLLVPVGARHVLARLRESLADPGGEIPAFLHPQLLSLAEEVQELEQRIEQVEACLTAQMQPCAEVQRLRSVPGIGLLGSTALVAFVGTAQRFHSGRKFASFLGLTPREQSSAG